MSADRQCKKKWHNHRKKQRGVKTTAHPEKFQGGKDELDGNFFDCTGCSQSDRFVKTAQKIADCIGQKRKRGGVSHAEVVTQTAVIIPMLTRPARTTTTAGDGAATTVPPDALDIGDCQSAKRIIDC